MLYKGLKITALLAICTMALLLSKVAAEDLRQNNISVPVINTNVLNVEIQPLTSSIESIDTIEYRESIKTADSNGGYDLVEFHYYYKKPYFLRVDVRKGSNLSIDIHTPRGIYEYFPSSGKAYYREKWEDGNPVSFQLKDKLADISIKGKYETFKRTVVDGMEWEIIRSVDENEGIIYEHRVWLSKIEGITLPFKEEYFVDGEAYRTHEFEYISLNKYIDDSFFKLEEREDLKIYDAPGIPKVVKDEAEAEKYVKFDVFVPEYVPENFTVNEICIIPPAKTPSVLITYSYLNDNIYFSQKLSGASEIQGGEKSKAITAGGKKFLIDKHFNDTLIAVRWAREGVEYEVSGPCSLKKEIIKLVYNISKEWIWID